MFLKNNKENWIHTVRRGSRTAATCKIEHFVIIVNGWKPLTIITKSSTLAVAVVLDPPLTVICFMRGDFSILSNLNAKVKKTFLKKTLKSRIWDPSVQNPESQTIGFQVSGTGSWGPGSWAPGPGGPGLGKLGLLVLGPRSSI